MRAAAGLLSACALSLPAMADDAALLEQVRQVWIECLEAHPECDQIVDATEQSEAEAVEYPPARCVDAQCRVQVYDQAVAVSAETEGKR